MHHARRSQFSFLVFLSGLAAGAIFAPRIKRYLSENEDMQSLRAEIDERFRQAKDFSQDAYNRVVDEAVDKYARAKGISQNELKDLASDLKLHWQRIKRAWQESGEDEGWS